MVRRTGHQEVGRPRSAVVRGAMARKERVRRTWQEDILISSARPEAGKLGVRQVVSYSLASHLLVLSYKIKIK